MHNIPVPLPRVPTAMIRYSRRNEQIKCRIVSAVLRPSLFGSQLGVSQRKPPGPPHVAGEIHFMCGLDEGLLAYRSYACRSFEIQAQGVVQYTLQTRDGP